MTRGKQKIEAQKRNAEKNQKAKGSQLEARAVALKVSCPICKAGHVHVLNLEMYILELVIIVRRVPQKVPMWTALFLAQLANQNQLADHYSSKHPKEKPPSETS
ncbi:hypothetical protein JRO89_XS01G0249900 [Xanthoceras sorbifolium]|uniref:Small EDRK-rich factor-like N-terminal domain-containing protein n=1 Tax=Xanthoceras sorbifolium TaxID=99658 RepID=A0ABQ8IL61_9ROSI|nr:hypothetical protein JRO89_XS01G0249900 [Xanthoceras sorbifolium]